MRNNQSSSLSDGKQLHSTESFHVCIPSQAFPLLSWHLCCRPPAYSADPHSIPYTGPLSSPLKRHASHKFTSGGMNILYQVDLRSAVPSVGVPASASSSSISSWPNTSASGGRRPTNLNPKQIRPCSAAARKGSIIVMAASTEQIGKKRALISVSDKSNLDKLAKGLIGLGYELVSTGGSAKAIETAGFPVTTVEELTGFPEMLDGRVKTLHPGVHGGILAKRDDAAHMDALHQHKLALIDVVVANLYPFRQTVTAEQTPSYEAAVENIDIGGPAMIRAAAKNHAHVSVCVDSADYDELLLVLGGNQEGSEAMQHRKRLAWKAYQHCASYDTTVADWLWNQVGEGSPPTLTVSLVKKAQLRYGENPHQRAAFYADESLSDVGQGGIATGVQHHGKEMSYNNYLDGDAAYTAVCDFREPTCVIVKHTNPCGIGSRSDLKEAYRLAVQADPTSAFGGIVAFNRPVDEELAEEIRQYRSPADGETRMFYEIVIAPGYTPEGLTKLMGKSKTLRILEAKGRSPSGRSLRQISGGWLYQDADSLAPENIEFITVSEAKPTEEQLEDLKFAWRSVKHVKSNAITVAKGQRLLGMGSGQPNRVKSVEIALEKAGTEVKGAALASDAFFPFSWNDSVEKACQAGIAAIAHPGGSVRDQDAVECCNKYGVVLVTTNIRHFKH